jgi:hypothetical protein
MKPKKYKIKNDPLKKIRGVWAIKPISRVSPDKRRKVLKRIEEKEKRE